MNEGGCKKNRGRQIVHTDSGRHPFTNDKSAFCSQPHSPFMPPLSRPLLSIGCLPATRIFRKWLELDPVINTFSTNIMSKAAPVTCRAFYSHQIFFNVEIVYTVAFIISTHGVLSLAVINL